MRTLLSICFASIFAASVSLAQSDPPYCQILDGTEEAAWAANFSYTAAAKVKAPEGNDVSMWSFAGGGGLYYWRTENGGWDLSGAYDVSFLDGSGGIKMPDRLVALKLGVSYVVRNSQGSALKVDLFPGIYSDVEDLSGKDLFLPLQVSAIQAFNPQISGLIGLAVYPGFQRTFDPRFGVRYAPIDDVRIDLMYPESRITYRPDELEFYAGIRHDAVKEFRLKDSDSRDSIALRETRALLGAAWPLSDILRMSVEVGYVINREIEFDHNAADHDWKEAAYFRVGLGGSI